MKLSENVRFMGVFIKSKSAGADQHKEGASGVDDTLIALPHPFQKLFQREVWNFIANKFHSLSKNVGYVSTSILTMMAFIAGSASTVSTETQEMPLNLYSIIFSPQPLAKLKQIKNTPFLQWLRFSVRKIYQTRLFKNTHPLDL